MYLVTSPSQLLFLIVNARGLVAEYSYLIHHNYSDTPNNNPIKFCIIILIPVVQIIRY